LIPFLFLIRENPFCFEGLLINQKSLKRINWKVVKSKRGVGYR